jgi:hypothetical protein
MSIVPSRSGLPTTLALRHRVGAALVLLAVALVTALFWLGVVRLLLRA